MYNLKLKTYKMKEINFRIIELESHQVLLTKVFDDEDKPVLIITVVINKTIASKRLTFEHEAERDLVFDNFTDEQAKEIVDNALTILNP